jgi:hypothetical protein
MTHRIHAGRDVRQGQGTSLRGGRNAERCAWEFATNRYAVCFTQTPAFIRSGVCYAGPTIDEFPYRTSLVEAPEQWGLLPRRSAAGRFITGLEFRDKAAHSADLETPKPNA